MADYAISNVPRRVVYAASGTGPYAFTFEILNQTDIAVYKASTLLTLTTDYTVTINANGTGSVTLVTSAGTSNITIVGAKNIQRTTDFTTGGDLFANTLNDELDNQTIFIQQVAETAERGLKAPVVDPTDINMTLPAKASRVGTVLAFNATTGNPEAGPSIGAVTTVAAQSANINTVATNIASVNTVAGNITNVNTVAGVSSNVTTVASNIANVNAVGADLLEGTSEINTVAVDIANVNTVGTNIASVNTVAGEIGAGQDVTVVAANLSGTNTIGTVATNIANVNATGTNIANVNAVGSDLLEAVSEINTVATDITNVNTVGTAIAAVNTVAGISGAVSTVSGIAANVTTVAGVSSNVTTVAGISGNVTTVAGIAANVTTVAGNSANVTIAATNVADINNFADVYQGAKATDPTLRNDGSALQSGDLYFNTTDDVMKVREAGAWLAAYASLSGALIAVNNLSDLASASSARTNLGLGTIATQAASSVAITGGAIDGTTIGATTASTGRFSDLTDTGLTSGRVTYAGTGGNLVDDADFTFNGTTVTMANDASISGLTAGKGGGAVAGNTVLGSGALASNITAGGTVAIGFEALKVMTAGDNCAAGYQSMLATTTGATNTAFGTWTLKANTTGSSNTAVGREALQANTTASNNTAVGLEALKVNTAAFNSAFGRQAGLSNTTGVGITAIGTNALTYNTTGTNNTAVGGTNGVSRGAALEANTTGSENVAVGTGALNSQTTGSNNTAIGYQAGLNNVTGANNLFVGMNAGNATQSGNNTIVGRSAGESVSSGGFNTLIGNLAGANITSGAKNTVLGRYDGNQGGLDIRTASNYIVLSDGDGNPRQIIDNSGAVLIGCTAAPSSTRRGVSIAANGPSGMQIAVANTLTAGFAGNIVFINGNGQVGSIDTSGTSTSYVTSSDYRLKENIAPMTGALATVAQLKPVTYNWKVDGSNGQGFIAHELQAVMPDCVSGEKDAVNEDGSIKAQGIDTSFLVATLTAALQEAHGLIKDLQTRVATLEAK
jgi:hypothetical protein